MKIFDALNEAARLWRREADRWSRRAMGGAPAGTMLELIRPTVGAHAPINVRRFVEPLVAVSALMALLTLGALGIVSFALFLLAGALIYAILTKVFGIELGIEMPNTNL